MTTAGPRALEQFKDLLGSAKKVTIAAPLPGRHRRGAPEGTPPRHPRQTKSISVLEQKGGAETTSHPPTKGGEGEGTPWWLCKLPSCPALPHSLGRPTNKSKARFRPCLTQTGAKLTFDLRPADYRLQKLRTQSPGKILEDLGDGLGNWGQVRREPCSMSF